MAHYAVGCFEPGKSGSPYSFICRYPNPRGPYALLNTKRANSITPDIGRVYLFELEDWRSDDPCKQYVTRIIAAIDEIKTTLIEALKGAEWEMVAERGRRQIRIVGRVLKTEYGYFEPQYDNGTRSNGMDEDPCIWFRACSASNENLYGGALGVTSGQSYLFFEDPMELKRAHDAGIATASPGDSV